MKLNRQSISGALIIALNLWLLLSSVSFFVKEPTALGWVAAITVGGALFVALYFQFPQNRRWQIKLVFLGALTACASISFWGFIIALGVIFSKMPNSSSLEVGLTEIGGVLLIFGALAFLCAREFVQTWRAR